jgi:hypothetical protein
VYGDKWAQRIKSVLFDHDLMGRPLHIISANLHSVVNAIYGFQQGQFSSFDSLLDFAKIISEAPKSAQALELKNYALAHGLIEIADTTGTNIGVQIIDLGKVSTNQVTLDVPVAFATESAPVLIVMDYAFGEQAFECMDELLKPYESQNKADVYLNVHSVSIMGKAGILIGHKGDLMVPTAHFFEGTADNYPFQNEFSKADFEGYGLGVSEGSMVTVLGTSLQNKEVLSYFLNSSWRTVGLEMEGAHYQKAIQAASKIRKSVRPDVKTLYAYYASDNPLETGSTLASGGLGLDGIKPTYLVTLKILQKTLATVK